MFERSKKIPKPNIEQWKNDAVEADAEDLEGIIEEQRDDNSDNEGGKQESRPKAPMSSFGAILTQGLLNEKRDEKENGDAKKKVIDKELDGKGLKLAFEASSSLEDGMLEEGEIRVADPKKSLEEINGPEFLFEGDPQMDMDKKIKELRYKDPRTGKPYDLSLINLRDGNLQSMSPREVLKKKERMARREGLEYIKKILISQYKELANIARETHQIVAKEPLISSRELNERLNLMERVSVFSSEQLELLELSQASFLAKARVAEVAYSKYGEVPDQFVREVFNFKPRGRVEMKKDTSSIHLAFYDDEDFISARYYDLTEKPEDEYFLGAARFIRDKNIPIFGKIISIGKADSRHASGSEIEAHEKRHTFNNDLMDYYQLPELNQRDRHLMAAKEEIIAFLSNGLSPEEIKDKLTKKENGYFYDEDFLLDLYEEKKALEINSAGAPADVLRRKKIEVEEAIEMIEREWEIYKRKVTRFIDEIAGLQNPDLEILAIAPMKHWKYLGDVANLADNADEIGDDWDKDVYQEGLDSKMSVPNDSPQIYQEEWEHGRDNF